MIQRAIPATLLALCMATPALGSELSLSLGGSVEYDENVFRTEDDEEDDVLFVIRPGVRIYEERNPDVNYSLGYRVPVELSTQFPSDLNDVDQIADGSLEYRVSDRLSFTAGERFRYLRSALRRDELSVQDVTTGLDVPTISEERDRVTTNDLSLGTQYLFAPRLMGRAQASWSYYDTNRDDRAENHFFGGVVDALYRMNQQHQVGGGVRYGYQTFDDREGIPGSETQSVGIFGSWRWFVDETTEFSVTAGPTWLTSEQDDAASSFGIAPVPFQRAPAGNYTGLGFSDIDGAPVTVVSGDDNLLVPSFFVGAGADPNCAQSPRSAGEFINPCTGNVILDSSNGGDLLLINAIRDAGNLVTVTNTANSGGDSDDVTVFAEAVLSKRWTPTVGSALRYSRRQGNAAGLGGAVITDEVSVSAFWDFLRRWQLTVRGDWVRRESLFRIRQTELVVAPTDLGGLIDVPGGQVPLAGFTGTAFNSSRRASIDTDRYSVAARVTHQLFRSTQVFGQVRYDQQESDRGSLGDTTDFENILAMIGFNHRFDSITLW